MTLNRETAAAAAGAAVGAGVWQLAVLTTRSPAVRVTAVLIVALASAAAIGYLTTRLRNRSVAQVIWTAAGTACAPALVVGFGMMQRPLWSLSFVLLYPVVVTLGYAGGRAAARDRPA